MEKKIVEHIKKTNKNVFHIDGDDLREIITNKDYSLNGRITNIKTAQAIAKFLYSKDFYVIVSLVSPYKWLRDEFKKEMNGNLIEIYVHTTEKRERDHYHVKDYEPPLNNFIDIDTTNDSPNDSFLKIINRINL